MELLKPGLGLAFWLTVILLISLLILRKVVWLPILAALEAREKRIEEALRRAEEAERRIQALEREHQEMRQRMLAEQQRIIEEAQRAYQRRMEEAEQKAKAREEEILRRARQEVQQLYQEARKKLIQEASELASQLAERILLFALRDSTRAEEYIRAALGNPELKQRLQEEIQRFEKRHASEAIV